MPEVVVAGRGENLLNDHALKLVRRGQRSKPWWDRRLACWVWCLAKTNFIS
jgi:hypothetical protein